MQIKSYSKKELAIAYSPDITIGAAVNKLVYWISLNPELVQSLQRMGYKKNQKVLTKKMVEEIFFYLGEP